MKKQLLFLAALCFFSINFVSAQKKIAVGGHLGFSKLTGDLSGGGLNWILDAKYYLKENITVGAEYNSSIMKAAGGSLLDGFYGGSQFLAKGEYYFTTTKVRPYAGLGLGFAKVETPEYSSGGTVVYPSISRTGFSLSPRLGVMLGKFAVEFQYNVAGKTPKETDVQQANKNFNYWTLNLGYVYPFEF